MTDYSAELWLFLTCVMLIGTGLVTLFVQAAPRWVTRLRRLEQGRRAMATDYVRSQAAPGDSTRG